MALFQTIEFSGPSLQPHLLVTAAVHGDEYEGVEALRKLARQVDASELTGKLTIVPVANESAYELGERTGSDGLDLARTFPGKRGGSITEKVAYRLARLIRTADYYIDLHSGGSGMRVEPLVGYMLVPDPRVLSEQREMARAFGLATIWGTTSELEGRSLSVARDAGVPAIYAEYLGGGECSPDGVEAYLNGCYNVMHRIGLSKNPREMPPDPERIVEDPRPGSGHMQIRHQSPVRGNFTPYVALGQTVEIGSILGHVMASSTRKRHPVQADSAGRVICLRSGPGVEKGDGLAVILETDPTKQKT